MHELTLLTEIMHKIEQVAADEHASAVTLVSLELGALAHISPEHLREHFEIASRATVAEHARLEIAVASDIADPNAQEIILRSVEVEE
jgi:hydrogenase nickel incorporation protein HypA/HybF